MAIPFNDLNDIQWQNILLTNSNIQRGGSLVGYRGTPFQRGYGLGSLFRTIFKFAAPLTKSIAKNVAKEGLSSAVGIGSDLLDGKDFKNSVKKRSNLQGGVC